MNAPAALYWYHQQPRTADYRNSSANRTGPYITELDMTGQPGVFKLVKYVPESEVAKLAAAMLAKAPPPPIVINNPDVAIVVNAAIKAEREKVAQLLAALKLARSYSVPDGDNFFGILDGKELATIDEAIAAAQPATVKESLTPEQQQQAAQAAANQKGK